jgi:hypothetical protein
MFGVGCEVFVAAAKFEEVEDGVAVSLRGETRREGAVHVRKAAFGELVRGVDSGEGVLHGHAKEVWSVEFEAAAGFGVAEECGGGVVEDERGFEGRSGETVLDERDFFAEVEALRLRLRWVEETTHATSEVGGLGKVRGVFGAGAAESEDSGLRRNSPENLVGALRGEIYDVIEMECRCHTEIVASMTFNFCRTFRRDASL